MRVTKGDIEITKNVLDELLKKIKDNNIYDSITETLIYLDVEMSNE